MSLDECRTLAYPRSKGEQTMNISLRYKVRWREALSVLRMQACRVQVILGRA